MMVPNKKGQRNLDNRDVYDVINRGVRGDVMTLAQDARFDFMRYVDTIADALIQNKDRHRIACLQRLGLLSEHADNAKPMLALLTRFVELNNGALISQLVNLSWLSHTASFEMAKALISTGVCDYIDQLIIGMCQSTEKKSIINCTLLLAFALEARQWAVVHYLLHELIPSVSRQGDISKLAIYFYIIPDGGLISQGIKQSMVDNTLAAGMWCGPAIKIHRNIEKTLCLADMMTNAPDILKPHYINAFLA